MAGTWDNVVGWSEKHPVMLGGGIVVGGLAILWLLGFFDKPAASADTGQSQMASAFYAAEAAATQSGNLLQIAQTQAVRDTAIAQIGAGRDTAVATTWAGAATTQTMSNNETSQHIAAIEGHTSEAQIAANQTVALAGLIIPAETGLATAEVAATGASNTNFTLPGFGTISLGTAQGSGTTPSQLTQSGFSLAQIRQMFGFAA
jgi:hypothetical protein